MGLHTMAPSPASGQRWSTSSFGNSTDTAPGELCALGRHLQQCQGGHPSLRALRRGADLLHGFVTRRFVSTLSVLAALGTLVLVLL
jgi:hypothetical protein